MSDRDAGRPEHTCTACSREVELCAFCERADCDDRVCYRCLLDDLGEARIRPRVYGD